MENIYSRRRKFVVKKQSIQSCLSGGPRLITSSIVAASAILIISLMLLVQIGVVFKDDVYLDVNNDFTGDFNKVKFNITFPDISCENASVNINDGSGSIFVIGLKKKWGNMRLDSLSSSVRAQIYNPYLDRVLRENRMVASSSRGGRAVLCGPENYNPKYCSPRPAVSKWKQLKLWLSQVRMPNFRLPRVFSAQTKLINSSESKEYCRIKGYISLKKVTSRHVVTSSAHLASDGTRLNIDIKHYYSGRKFTF